jgi:50S ribosomal protein L16 3-hydroxylase
VPALSLPIDYEDFLARYWQREALYIPQGVPGFQPPLDADELAGLALEPGVDSRIVSRQDGQWSQQRGPFETDDLQRGGSWSLLVNRVDHYYPAAAELFDLLPFLPRWRLDDVLMSYASAGGGAGPHFDLYDVFIIQGEGQRIWEIGQRCDGDSELIGDTDLKLLTAFHPRARHTLSCGDVLYIPPGIAHRGESVGESTSFSIGFRAPSLRDLLARWVDNRLEALPATQLLSDPRREAAVHAGEITRHDIERAQQQLIALMDLEDPRWLGEVLTERSDEGSHTADIDLQEPGSLRLVPGARLAWLRREDHLLVFASGESRSCPTALRDELETLGAGQRLDVFPGSSSSDMLDLLHWLIDSGTLQGDDD